MTSATGLLFVIAMLSLPSTIAAFSSQLPSLSSARSTYSYGSLSSPLKRQTLQVRSFSKTKSALSISASLRSKYTLEDDISLWTDKKRRESQTKLYGFFSRRKKDGKESKDGNGDNENSKVEKNSKATKAKKKRKGFFARRKDTKNKEKKVELDDNGEITDMSTWNWTAAALPLVEEEGESTVNETNKEMEITSSDSTTSNEENEETPTPADEAVKEIIVPADANVLGVSSSTSFFPEDNTSEEPKIDSSTSEPENSEKKKKNIISRVIGGKRSKSKKKTKSPSKEGKELVSANNVIKTTNSDNGTEKALKKKKKKRRFLPKHFSTYVSLALLLFLGAPMPKRFTAFLDDDTNSGIVKQRYSVESSKESKKDDKNDNNNNDWWKESKVPQSSDDSTSNSFTPDRKEDPSQNNERQKDFFPQESSPKITEKKTEIPQLTPPMTATQTEPKSIKSSTSFVAAAVKKIGPAVVRVDTEIYASASDDPSYYLNPFGQPDSDEGDSSSDQLIRSGQGSGIIFSHHGLVLTNAHVVDGASRVYVTLTDGRKFVAEVTGVDEMVDLAVLKILEHAPWGGHSPWGNGSAPNSSQNRKTSVPNGKQYRSDKTNSWKGEPLPVAKLGDSNDLQVGEFVIAVGNPGGLDNTVTMGIVSSLKRSSEEIGLPSKKVTFIQTDAAVNPGNSGGPLVNEHGEIIGINTCIRANMEGIAFAIPINKAKEIMFDLAEGKNIQHGYIGVVMMTVTPDFARQNNLDPNSPVGIIPEVHGVMIERVLGNTPAAIEGGLRRLDIVLSIGGVPVKNAGDAARLVDSAKVGEDLEVKILRGGKEMVTVVKPGDLAEKMRQKKQMMKRQTIGKSGVDGGGGRIFVLPIPAP